MEKIESLANSKLKLAAALSRAKDRAKEKAFVAEGIRLGEEAVNAHIAKRGWTVRFGLVTPEETKKERSAALVKLAEEVGIAVYEVPENLYKKAAQTVSPQGILFVVNLRETALPELLNGRGGDKAPLIAVLDGVQDPGNVGTILRTAEAVGATGAILLEGTADLYGEKCVRAATGAFFRLPCCKMTAAELRDFAAKEKIALYAAAVDKSAKMHLAADFSRPAIIAFGREGSGVSPEILAAAERIYIPMAGGAESFNVAQSAAIILYEALRQRHYADRSPQAR